jgi:hypothetical protein
MWEITGRPVLVTEFSYFAVDNLSGNDNTFWAGEGRVLTREQRAYGYRAFVEGLAGTSFVIGCDWFQWADEPPTGRHDGENLNCGIVSIYDQPYPEMIKTVKETSERVNKIHSKSNDRQDGVVWKQDPSRLGY